MGGAINEIDLMKIEDALNGFMRYLDEGNADKTLPGAVEAQAIIDTLRTMKSIYILHLTAEMLVGKLSGPGV
jgi:hypothetical protein